MFFKLTVYKIEILNNFQKLLEEFKIFRSKNYSYKIYGCQEFVKLKSSRDCQYVIHS